VGEVDAMISQKNKFLAHIEEEMESKLVSLAKELEGVPPKTPLMNLFGAQKLKIEDLEFKMKH
jgi:hypothetical protein